MTWLIFLGIAVLIAIPLLIKLLSTRGVKISRHPYQKQTALFSPDDRALFRALKEAVGEQYEIFAKIRVNDIILPKKGVSLDGRGAFNPLAERHFDFILCDRNNFTVACVIQLHDKTNPDRQGEQRDDPLVLICENLNLPFVRFPIQADYSIEALREKLRQAMVKEPFYMLETDGRKEPRISNIEDIKF